MDALKRSFEKDLKQKLSQKATGMQSEETTLLKSFKFFDINNSGDLSPEEFAKAIEKIGIQIPTRQDLAVLFSLYDTDQSGVISYREFCSELFGFEVGGSQPTASQSNPESLIDRLRQKLASRGARGIIGLSRQFRIMDDNHSMSLDRYEFAKAMADYALGFTENEIVHIFNYFDYNRNNLVEYDEFLRTVRGPMNPQRKAITGKAFDILDKDGNGYIELRDIQGVYNATKHPDVLAGKKTEQQILQEFLETFEAAHAMRNNKAPDNIVTREEFEEYYNNISASIDRDDYFAQMMNSAWNLDNSRVTKSGWGNNAPQQKQRPSTVQAEVETQSRPVSQQSTPRQQQEQAGTDIFGNSKSRKPAQHQDIYAGGKVFTDAQLQEQMTKKLAARGARGINGLSRQFRIADDNRSMSLAPEEFVKCIHDFRVELNQTDALRLFAIYDRDQSGEISYDEFLRGVVGEMNAFRTNIAMQAFAIMDKDKSGVIDIDDIRQSYNALKHPDVIAGKKTEDEVLYEFLDTFEQHHSDSCADARDGSVTQHEWKEYYNNVSCSIERDDYFELMMNNAWNLKGDRVTKKGWGGA